MRKEVTDSKFHKLSQHFSGVYEKSIEDHQAEKPSILIDIATQEIPNRTREFDISFH
jgi:hypothetical protein